VGLKKTGERFQEGEKKGKETQTNTRKKRRKMTFWETDVRGLRWEKNRVALYSVKRGKENEGLGGKFPQQGGGKWKKTKMNRVST